MGLLSEKALPEHLTPEAIVAKMENFPTLQDINKHIENALSVAGQFYRPDDDATPTPRTDQERYISTLVPRAEKRVAELMATAKAVRTATGDSLLRVHRRTLCCTFVVLQTLGLDRLVPAVGLDHEIVYNRILERVALVTFRNMIPGAYLFLAPVSVYYEDQHFLKTMYRNFVYSLLREYVRADQKSPGVLEHRGTARDAGRRRKTVRILLQVILDPSPLRIAGC